MIEADGERVRLAHPLYGSAAIGTARRRPTQRALHRRLTALVGRAGGAGRAPRARHGGARPRGGRGRRGGGPRGGGPRRRRRGAPARRARAPARRRASPAAFQPRGVGLRVHRGRHRAGARAARHRGATEQPRVRAEALVGLSTLATYDGTIPEARDAARRALESVSTTPRCWVVIHRRLALAHLLMAELDVAEEYAAKRWSSPRATRASRRRRTSPASARSREPVGRAEVSGRLSSSRRSRWPRSTTRRAAIAGLVLMYRGDLDGARTPAARRDSRPPGRAAANRSAPGCCSRSRSSSRAPGTSRPRSPTPAAAWRRRSGRARRRSGRCCCSPRGSRSPISAGQRPLARPRREGLAIAQRAEHRFAEAQNRWALGLLELSLGHPAEAWPRSSPRSAMMRERVGERPWSPCCPRRSRRRRRSATPRRRARCSRSSRRGTLAVAHAAARRCRGLVSAVEGDTDAAFGSSTRQCPRAQDARRPFEVARTGRARLGAAAGAAVARGARIARRGRARVRRARRRGLGRAGPRRGGARGRPPRRPIATSSPRASCRSPSSPPTGAPIARSPASCSCRSAPWRRSSRAPTASSGCARVPSFRGGCRRKSVWIPRFQRG